MIKCDNPGCSAQQTEWVGPDGFRWCDKCKREIAEGEHLAGVAENRRTKFRREVR